MYHNSGVIVPQDHILYSAESEVQQICRPFFKKTKLDSFEYHQFYKDGTTFCISTCSEWTRQYYLEGLYPFLEELERTPHYTILSPEMPFPTAAIDTQKVMNDLQLAKNFNITHRIYMTTAYQDYFEVFGCGFTRNDCDKNSYNNLEYLINKINAIEEFALYFKEKARKLIEQATLSRIAINNFFNIMNQKKENDVKLNKCAPREFLVICEQKEVVLSKREAQCLYHLLQGKTAKETANTLCISPRTVEVYLRSLKDKTNSGTKIDIIAKIDKLHFLRSYKNCFEA